MIKNPLENPSEICVRCGRPYIMQNLIHTRLHGTLCVCGSDQWEPRKDDQQKKFEKWKGLQTR